MLSFHNKTFAANNREVTHAFSSHPKILVTALNGPVVGLSAATIAHSDFIYAAPHTYLLVPFSSLGLVSEGGAAKTFADRMGIAKANEALIMSKRLQCNELLASGFINQVFQVQPGEDEKFLSAVLHEVNERLGPHLVKSSLLEIKRQIRTASRRELDILLMDEVQTGLDRFAAGIPQEEFAKIASGKKRHKL
jgi:Delta3-Delta2-enoyl-CoA isomerase